MSRDPWKAKRKNVEGIAFSPRWSDGYLDGYNLYSSYFIPTALDPSGEVKCYCVYVPDALSGGPNSGAFGPLSAAGLCLECVDGKCPFLSKQFDVVAYSTVVKINITLTLKNSDGCGECPASAVTGHHGVHGYGHHGIFGWEFSQTFALPN